MSWQKDTQVVLERNPDYWDKDADGTQLPYLDKITFKPFPDENVRLTNVKTGDADVLMGNPPFKDIEDLKKSTDLQYKEIAGLGFQFIFINTQKEPFTNPAVRRALSLRDRPRSDQPGGVLRARQDAPVAGARKSFRGRSRLTVCRTASGMWPRPSRSSQSAGVTDPSFTFQISNASPQLQQVAELIKDQIKEVGINMDIQLIEFATVVQNGNTGEYQALSLGWSGDVDPDGDLYSLFYTKAGFNFAKYSNPDFDKLLDDGRTEPGAGQARPRPTRTRRRSSSTISRWSCFYNPPQISVVRKDIQNYPADLRRLLGRAGLFQNLAPEVDT